MAKILIIDDEETIRFAFEDFLKKEGHSVFSACSYEEALAVIAEVDLDLIFSDILLEGKGGMEILREVKERNMLCPVIMITGYPNVESASEAVRLGAFDYISKPLRRDALLHSTKLGLQHKALLEEKEAYRQNLDAVFRSVKDAIITVDSNRKILALNDAAADICSITADAVGKSFDSLPSVCKKSCLQALGETLESGRSVEIYRMECGRVDRERQMLNLSVYPLIDGKGLFSGGVMVARDETRLAGLEEDLKQRRVFHNMIGKSEEMQRLYELIDALADVDTTVLITGESGTGKEMVAEALRYRSQRSDKPFVRVNCAALSENLLESELFGHVRGAFTGAVKDKVGRFEKADKGTIFLDEIGNISPKMQLSLLRVLQEKELERVGDSNPTKIDVRVIAATNQNLREKVASGEFREDLYYRLRVMEIRLAPLRNRQDDIPLLVAHFLKKFNGKFNKRINGVSEEVEKLFMQYSWPGNIRELEHAIEHAFVLCRQDCITVDHLPSEFHGSELLSSANEEKSDYETLIEALRSTGGNKAKAARRLGVSERTVFRKIRQYDITESQFS